jgi:hypothetical protein
VQIVLKLSCSLRRNFLLRCIYFTFYCISDFFSFSLLSFCSRCMYMIFLLKSQCRDFIFVFQPVYIFLLNVCVICVLLYLVSRPPFCFCVPACVPFSLICEQSPNFLTFKEPRNRFQGISSSSLCSLAGRYDNPIPTRFLAPIDCLKIPALLSLASRTPFCFCNLLTNTSLFLQNGFWPQFCSALQLYTALYIEYMTSFYLEFHLTPFCSCIAATTRAFISCCSTTCWAGPLGSTFHR